MNSPKRVNSFMTLYFIWEITGVQILVVIFGVLMGILMPNMSAADNIVNMTLIQDVFLLLLPILLGLKLFGSYLEEMIPLKGLSLWNVIYIVMTGFLMLPVMAFISSVTAIFSPSTSTEVENAIMEAPFPVGMLIMAVLPAVFEETFFRGFVYGGLKRFGRKKAMVLSAFYFGLFHLSGYQIPYAMFCGIILAVAAEYSGSILGSMLLHFTINGTQVAVSYLMASGADDAAMAAETAAAAAETAPGLSYYLLFAFMAAIFLVLLLLTLRGFIRYNKKNMLLQSLSDENREAEEEKPRFIDVFFLANILIVIAYLVFAPYLEMFLASR